MQRITVNLIVNSIEACLPFWEGRLGFDRAVEAPEGDVLGFVVLEKDGLEIMLQTPQSLSNDIVELSAELLEPAEATVVDDAPAEAPVAARRMAKGSSPPPLPPAPEAAVPMSMHKAPVGPKPIPAAKPPAKGRALPRFSERFGAVAKPA